MWTEERKVIIEYKRTRRALLFPRIILEHPNGGVEDGDDNDKEDTVGWKRGETKAVDVDNEEATTRTKTKTGERKSGRPGIIDSFLMRQDNKWSYCEASSMVAVEVRSSSSASSQSSVSRT